MSKNYKAIIVEDSRTITRMYREILAKYDCVVDPVNNLEEAREILSKNTYDIFLLDYFLPDGIVTDLIEEFNISPSKCFLISGKFERRKEILKIAEEFNIPRENVFKKPLDLKILDLQISKQLELPNTILNQDMSSLLGLFFEYLKNQVKKMRIKHFIFTSFLILFMFTFVPSYVDWKSHRLNDEFDKKVKIYAEERFKHFVLNKNITKKTYVEFINQNGCDIFTLRIYPDSFIWLKIECEVHGVKTYWINHNNFLREIGLDSHDMTFLELVLRSLRVTGIKTR